MRAAKIRTKNIETTRPIVKLYPLEVTCGDEKSDTKDTFKRAKRSASINGNENMVKYVVKFDWKCVWTV